MKILLLLLGLSVAAGAADLDQALSVKVARQSLKNAMTEIAQEIGKRHKDFPQLKKWKRAEISDHEIRYQYSHKNISCDLLIYSKNTMELASASSALPNELKVGIYLKMNATGEKAEALKETLREIVASRFEKVRQIKNATHAKD
ncbi:MAG: hypothetical protein Q8P84_01335 [Deltaproteobacteria bacterium]|nr:hypothetical protein [Deltaproteobacteria bacterium]